MPVDLVLLSLGGVQRFIVESRSTADVAGASKIVQDLAGLAAHAVQRRLVGSPEPCGLIFPAIVDAPSVTNKRLSCCIRGVGVRVRRSVRGRPSQVKGACGVAARWRKRHP
ncbi:MAG: hypothetical protein M3Q39_13100 [Actinomycetota bacterium]|nr:hypothetical protein [Actinomycetota bacterium]